MHANFNLADRVALVTGGSSGVGLAIAQALAHAGADLILIGRRDDTLQAEAEQVHATTQRRVHTLVADLSDRPLLLETAERGLAAFGRVDILVNAAGVNLRKPIEEVDFSIWDMHIDLHLTAPFFLAKSLAPGMQQRGWGRIINLASLQSLRAFPNGAPYGAGKGGIVQLTRAMAETWGKDGITVNAIAPGFFPTALTAPVFENPELAAENARKTMIGRNGRMEDLAGPAVFLASPAAAYVTGQVLFVDGGYSAK